MTPYMYFVSEEDYYPDHGYRASIVHEGVAGRRLTGDWPVKVNGVRPYFWGHNLEKARTHARSLNKRMGLSDEDQTRILTSSIKAQVQGAKGGAL